jgi:hypothetical protein
VAAAFLGAHKRHHILLVDHKLGLWPELLLKARGGRGLIVTAPAVLALVDRDAVGVAAEAGAVCQTTVEETITRFAGEAHRWVR